MNFSENKRAPSLGGWFIAAGAGIVTAAVAVVVGHFDYSQSAFFGAGIFLLVGLILGMHWGGQPAPFARSAVQAPKPAQADEPASFVPTVTPSSATAAEESMPAAFLSSPIADTSSMAASAPRVAKEPSKTAVAKILAKPAAAKTAKVKKADGPLRLSAPRKGKADDLKAIEGIGPALEKLCNSLGFYHFDQIASWSDTDVEWVDANMKTFKGRIVRDKWIAQSKLIVSEGLEAFRVRAQTNDY